MCVYICIYVYMYMYICMYVVCMYICMYVYLYMYLFRYVYMIDFTGARAAAAGGVPAAATERPGKRLCLRHRACVGLRFNLVNNGNLNKPTY